MLQAGRWVIELEDCCCPVVLSCCEKLVAEVRGALWNPEEGERPLSKDSEDVIVDTGVCVCNSELWSVVTHCIKESNKYDYQSKPRL
jgi:hypothetical protein